MNGITCEGCVCYDRGFCPDVVQLCDKLRETNWCQKQVFERNLEGAVRLMELRERDEVA